jgi:hypothetical protein
MQALVDAMDRLDVDALVGQFAPGGRLMTADGRRAEGPEALRGLLSEFFGELRSTTHTVTQQWQEDNVSIAEIDASYELRDWLRLNDLPRVFILRDGPEGIEDLRVYGAHEHPIAEHRTGEEGMLIGARWIPPL